MASLDRQQSGRRLDAATRWRFHEGNRVGELARTQLGGGTILPPAFTEKALLDSTAAIAVGGQTLFEASVSAAGLIARLDALVPCDGGWELVEVKSGKMPENGAPKVAYIDDAAFSLSVAQLAGVPVVRVSLMLLSRAYTLGSDGVLLERVDVTDAAMARATEFRVLSASIVHSIAGVEQPQPLLKMACKSCDYFSSICIGRDVDDSVLRIPRLSEKKLTELLPCERIRLLPASSKLTANQQQVVEAIRSGNAWRDDAVLAELGQVRWPACYLDFEAAMPAVPWFQGDGTYTTLPNQFSVHVCTGPGEIQRHLEYLAAFDADWRRELAEQLLSALDGDGSIVVYSSYEKTQLAAMAARFPDLAGRIGQVSERLFDLERFFKVGYVHHRYAGSSSIKKVLPVLVPGLTYETMAVRNGSDAAGLFCLMRENVIPLEEHATHRSDLLEYCKLDTLAMVQLHHALAALLA